MPEFVRVRKEVDVLSGPFSGSILTFLRVNVHGSLTIYLKNRWEQP